MTNEYLIQGSMDRQINDVIIMATDALDAMDDYSEQYPGWNIDNISHKSTNGCWVIVYDMAEVH